MHSLEYVEARSKVFYGKNQMKNFFDCRFSFIFTRVRLYFIFFLGALRSFFLSITWGSEALVLTFVLFHFNFDNSETMLYNFQF